MSKKKWHLEELSSKKPNCYIISCIDAKNDNVYAAIYRKDNDKICQFSNYISDNVEVLVDVINGLDGAFTIIGDGIEVVTSALVRHGAEIPSTPQTNASEFEYESASKIAEAAFDLYKQGIVTDGVHVSPLYLKKSQAERELEEKS